jgi:hypothetical protein
MGRISSSISKRRASEKFESRKSDRRNSSRAQGIKGFANPGIKPSSSLAGGVSAFSMFLNGGLANNRALPGNNTFVDKK